MKRALLLWILLLPLSATAATQLEDVLDSTLRHFPLIRAARADIDAKAALVLAANGSFDERIDGTATTRLGGYYESRGLDMTVVRPLTSMNARVFGGYRITGGDFAGYEGKELTGSLGEFRMGFALSLLRNRDIDDRRAAVKTAELQTEVEAQQLVAEQVKALRQAYQAYARWLLAHRLAGAYRELLTMAEERGRGLARSVDAGNAASILLVENRQAELQRAALVTEAERQIDVAAQLLSLYWRDADGLPRTAEFDAALELPGEKAGWFGPSAESLIARALARRPELAIARLAQQQAGVKQAQAENLARPQADLRVYTARDLGNRPTSLAGVDNVVDLSFSIPLQTREARGKAAAAQAEYHGLSHQIALLEQQVGTDIRSALVTLDATRKLEALAAEELAASETLAAAERRRFDAGQSDFFLVNQRERQVAEAQLKRWQSHLTHQTALADFLAASMNLEAFGAAD